ncbi:hypothetical protein IJU85_03840 [Candidatus Saccharibacteria bacterium]|nr:hypothetical protein [Candidatus Saccharibacteria bacterium]
MDSITSGSIVEPRVALEPNKSSSKNNKIILIITIIIEAIIIICLSIALILTNNALKQYEPSKEEAELNENNYMEEEPLYQLTKKEALALMYVYSMVNDELVKNKTMPSDYCAVLQNIYNYTLGVEDDMEDPCASGAITLVPADNMEEELASVGQIYIGVGLNGETYNYYVFSDFSVMSHVDMTESIPTNSITINVSGS